jgi:poly-gamma-glutamate synthesis protein (capsule biosynthesis protein)
VVAPQRLKLSLSLALALASIACARPTGIGIQPTASTAAGSTVPAPGQPRIAVPNGLQDRFVQVLAKLDPGTAPRPAIVAEGQPSDVIVTRSNEVSPDVHVARTWSVATAAGRLNLDDVRLDRLAQQAQSGPMYIAEDYVALVRPLFADASGLRPVPAGTLASRLSADPSALAIIPSDTASVSVRVVSLDGIDAVRTTALENYPLTTRVRIAPAKKTAGAEALARALANSLAAPGPAVTAVIFTGDIIPTRCVYDQMRIAGDWAAPFSAVASRLATADLAVGSLDASISDVGAPIGCEETFNLLAPPQVVQGFQAAHLRAMTVAANHAKDCGRAVYCLNRAFLDTLTNLRRAGIEPAGGGTSAAEARLPAVVTVNGTRFAILGYDDIADYYHATATIPGTAGLDLSTLADDVHAALKVADVVIVMPHWGTEYTPDPTGRQQQAAKIAIDAGATMIVGNHPHVVQAAAPLGNGYAAYALGNFVFDQDWSVETTQGVILEATFVGTRLAEVQFQPLEIHNRLRPVFLSPDDGAPILKRMMDAAARLSP